MFYHFSDISMSLCPIVPVSPKIDKYGSAKRHANCPPRIEMGFIDSKNIFAARFFITCLRYEISK